MLIKSSKLHKTVVLCLDGVPHSLIIERMKDNPLSIWHRLLDVGKMARINSSIPEVSSVAWAGYLTGENPGSHGLFGFAEWDRVKRRIDYPNGSTLKVKTLLERVNDAGGKVVSINVPATYPPKKVDGLVVGGFLGVFLEKNVHPVEWLPRLRHHNYQIDADVQLAYKDKTKLMEELFKLLDARLNLALEAWSAIDWDLFQLHLMETDRLFHFFWGDTHFNVEFDRLLDRIESIVSKFEELALVKNAELVILSDHGFTGVKKVFFINTWLQKMGYLRFDGQKSHGYDSISNQSRAYALPPARIFLTDKGKNDSRLIEELKSKIQNIHDPETGENIFRTVYRKDEIYSGNYVSQAAELICMGNDGFDLKADMNSDKLFTKPEFLLGTHTWSNAFFYVRNQPPDWADDTMTIEDAGGYVKRLVFGE
ncbi:alkaline phosphatase family protein [bacterium]|nr:alkaline phosphatase family protein [bacterium]